MRRKEGSIAPYFSAVNTDGALFDLATPRNKPLLLAFFRYASCPLCNLRVHELISRRKELEEVVEIVLVFQSPTDKIAKYVGKQEVPYRIIPDPERYLYRLYGVESSWAGFAKAWSIEIARVFQAVIAKGYLPGTVEGEIHRIPADFIIDTQGKIVRAYYGKDIGDHMPVEAIFEAAKDA